MLELGEDHGVRVLRLRGRVGVDEKVLVVAGDREVPAFERLGQVGAERAQPVLEELGELSPSVLVGELYPHSPVVGHTRRIVRPFESGAGELHAVEELGEPVEHDRGAPERIGVEIQSSRLHAFANRARFASTSRRPEGVSETRTTRRSSVSRTRSTSPATTRASSISETVAGARSAACARWDAVALPRGAAP